jgi:hypothetical protein
MVDRTANSGEEGRDGGGGEPLGCFAAREVKEVEE